MGSMRGLQFLSIALASACQDERKGMLRDRRVIARMTTLGADQTSV
jgi:hypothetical protein